MNAPRLLRQPRHDARTDGLSDLLSEADFLDVQIQVIHETAPTHKGRDWGLRLAALHHRMYDLEEEMRLHASMLGESAMGPGYELRSRLREVCRRQDVHDPDRRMADQ